MQIYGTGRQESILREEWRSRQLEYNCLGTLGVGY